jgi:hypothetical protein
MAALTDLINPTFLMFLGIMVLVVALLVVYFESKFRDQNHKISSMLSLVSSLAEELNGTKMVIQHLSMRGGQQQNEQPELKVYDSYTNLSNSPILDENLIKNTNNIKLIQVSDDENSDSESESSDSDDSESVHSSDSESSELDENTDKESIQDLDENSVIEIGEHNNDIKILKLNIPAQKDDESVNSEDVQNLDFDDLDELENLSDSSDSVSIKEELDEMKEVTEINDTKDDSVKSMNLKSIHINLEETKSESMDYKKMALPKLRSIVTEKGLSNDASKLKKNELLKLLGIE